MSGEVWIGFNRNTLVDWNPAINTAGSVLLNAGYEIYLIDTLVDNVCIRYNGGTTSQVSVIAAY